jgi:hypothetical protein
MAELDIENDTLIFHNVTGNRWYDTEMMGNYWSDHTAPDEDSDGIVDTPYLIPGDSNATDKYPLTTPFDMEIKGPSYPLNIQTLDKISIKAGTEYSVQYSALSTSPEEVNLTWNMLTNANWLTFTDEQILQGTPQMKHIGDYWVNVSVTDGKQMDFHLFNLYVYDEVDPTIGTGGNTTNVNETEENKTEPDSKNQPPSSVSIMAPMGTLYSNERINLSAFSFDPDLEDGEVLNYTWYIIAIGKVGEGANISIILEPGTYELVLNVTDPDGGSIEVTRILEVKKRSSISTPAEGGNRTWYERNLQIMLFFAIAAFLTLMIITIIMMRKTRSKIDKDGTVSKRSNGEVRAKRRSRMDEEINGPSLKPSIPLEKGIGPMDLDISDNASLTADLLMMELDSSIRPSHISLDNDDILEGLKRLMKKKRISRETYKELKKALERTSPEEE